MTERQQALQNALDSFALEALFPTEENLNSLQAWLNGEMNDQELMVSANEIWQRSRSLSQ